MGRIAKPHRKRSWPCNQSEVDRVNEEVARYVQYTLMWGCMALWQLYIKPRQYAVTGSLKKSELIVVFAASPLSLHVLCFCDHECCAVSGQNCSGST